MELSNRRVAMYASRRERTIGPIKLRDMKKREALELVRVLLECRLSAVVGFCNAHTVNLAREDKALCEALSSAVLFNDGVGLDIASRLLHGTRFSCNLNGTDLSPAILDHVKKPLRVFLLGSAPGVAARAGEVLAARFPHHRFVGSQHGFFADATTDEIKSQILAAEPDLILVGMGQPRQEIWATRHLANFKGVVMCVGAFLDFSAGEVSRAPEWVRSLRLEWVYRLMLEPRRLGRRYLLGNVTFMLNLIRDVARGLGNDDGRVAASSRSVRSNISAVRRDRAYVPVQQIIALQQTRV